MAALFVAVNCGASDVTAPAATTAPFSDAESILVRQGTRFPVAGAERACLVGRLDVDADLRRRIGSRLLSPESAEYQELQTLSSACIHAVTSAQAFLLMESRKASSPLTQQQSSCLRDGFLKLDRPEVDRVLAAGVEVSDGPAVAIERSCGI